MSDGRRLLACIDLSAHSESVLRAADELAVASGATVHVLHVAEGEPAFMGFDEKGGPHDLADHATEVERERTQLDAVVAAARLRSPTELLVVAGPIVRAALDVADGIAAATIVIGRHGHGGLLERVMGSVATDLVRHSTRPVLVVPVAG